MQSNSDGNDKMPFDLSILARELQVIKSQNQAQHVQNTNFERKIYDLETNLEKANKRIDELEKQLIDEVGRAQDLANKALSKLKRMEEKEVNNKEVNDKEREIISEHFEWEMLSMLYKGNEAVEVVKNMMKTKGDIVDKIYMPSPAGAGALAFEVQGVNGTRAVFNYYRHNKWTPQEIVIVPKRKKGKKQC